MISVTSSTSLHSVYSSALVSSNGNEEKYSGKDIPPHELHTCVCISDKGQQALTIEKLEKELDNIFGSPKVLSEAEKEQEKMILAEIDKLLALSEPKLSKEDLKKEEELIGKLDSIFSDGKVTKEEEKQLASIDKEFSKLFGDAQKNIAEPMPLSVKDQAIADKIMKQIDAIFSDEKVTADEEKALKSLDERLASLFDKSNGTSSSQDKKLDELFAQLDKLYGLKTPSKSDLVKADDIFSQLDKLYSAFNANDNKLPFTYG